MRMRGRQWPATSSVAAIVLFVAGAVASAAGCSCDAGGNPTPGFTLVFAFVAATLWARGRRAG